MLYTHPRSLPLYSVSEAEPVTPIASGSATSGVHTETPERRHHSKPIPVNISEYLNDDQQLSLRQMEGFGWQLAFIRRPLFQDTVVVVTNTDQSKFGVLELDGSINMDSMMELRH